MSYYTIQDLNEAIRLGWIMEAKKMILDGVVPNQTTLSYSIENGWPKLFIKLLVNKGVYPTVKDLYLAVLYGHKDIVEYLLKLKIIPTEIHMITAINHNYKPIILLLLPKVTLTHNMLDSAISTENISLVKFLIKKGIKPTMTQLEIADITQNKKLISLISSSF
jgi:hypothetical protein